MRAGPRKVEIATKAQFDVWMRDHGRDQGAVTFRMPSHRLLALLARGRPWNHIAAASFILLESLLISSLWPLAACRLALLILVLLRPIV